MQVDVSEAGWLELWRGATLISRHRQEREAWTSALRHANTAGPGDYELRRGIIRIRVTASAVAQSAGEIDATLGLP
jgi:hypothetical protein